MNDGETFAGCVNVPVDTVGQASCRWCSAVNGSSGLRPISRPITATYLPGGVADGSSDRTLDQHFSAPHSGAPAVTTDPTDAVVDVGSRPISRRWPAVIPRPRSSGRCPPTVALPIYRSSAGDVDHIFDRGHRRRQHRHVPSHVHQCRGNGGVNCRHSDRDHQTPGDDHVSARSRGGGGFRQPA